MDILIISLVGAVLGAFIANANFGKRISSGITSSLTRACMEYPVKENLDCPAKPAESVGTPERPIK
jgi:hypothetical protein